MVTIKSKSEIEKMKIAGQVTYGALKAVEAAVKPGVTTAELDRVAEKYARRRLKDTAAFPQQSAPA